MKYSFLQKYPYFLPKEVRGVSGAAGELCWAPADAPVSNPAFDVTPASLVDHWILDTGVFDGDAVAAGALKR